MANDTIRISPKDNVAVTLLARKAGDAPAVEGAGPVVLLEDVEQNHKFALQDIAKGEKVIKYGYPIGAATSDIRRGQWVHLHNLGEGEE